MEHYCAICKQESANVGALIGSDNDHLICDDCIVKACDQYAGANAISPENALSTMRYRQALRRIAQRQKQAQAEMDKAMKDNPDLAFPNGKLDGTRS